MPNIDEAAKEWQTATSKRVGQAVARLRAKAGVSAVRLSDQTRQLGFPISRVAISKIENNARAGKMELAEVMVIAAALGVSPGQLIFPDLPAGEVEVLPGERAESFEAVQWLSGEYEWAPSQDGFEQVDELIEPMKFARKTHVLRNEARWAADTVDVASRQLAAGNLSEDAKAGWREARDSHIERLAVLTRELAQCEAERDG